MEELKVDEHANLSWVPKFITAADAVLPGNDSDYDTDLELEDVYEKLDQGIQNIYEGTGRIIYEATCKTEGVVPISFILNRYLHLFLDWTITWNFVTPQNLCFR